MFMCVHMWGETTGQANEWKKIVQMLYFKNNAQKQPLKVYFNHISFYMFRIKKMSKVFSIKHPGRSNWFMW